MLGLYKYKKPVDKKWLLSKCLITEIVNIVFLNIKYERD